jgi:hypothetical protein
MFKRLLAEEKKKERNKKYYEGKVNRLEIIRDFLKVRKDAGHDMSRYRAWINEMHKIEAMYKLRRETAYDPPEPGNEDGQDFHDPQNVSL